MSHLLIIENVENESTVICLTGHPSNGKQKMRTWCANDRFRQFFLITHGGTASMLQPSILDKIGGKFVPPSPPNQGWENGAFWLLRGFILDLGGWGFAVPFYLSKIIASTLALKGGPPKYFASLYNR